MDEDWKIPKHRRLPNETAEEYWYRVCKRLGYKSAMNLEKQDENAKILPFTKTKPTLAIDNGGDNDPDWLSKLPIVTVFLVRSKTDRRAYPLMEFHIVDKTDDGKAVKLLSNINPQQMFIGWVEPKQFCNQWERWSILGDYSLRDSKDEPSAEEPS